MAISPYNRRLSPRLSVVAATPCIPFETPLLALPGEVCLAWIRLLPVVRGVYTSWTIARGNVLNAVKSRRYTASKKEISTYSLAEHACPTSPPSPRSPLYGRLRRIDARLVNNVNERAFGDGADPLRHRIPGITPRGERSRRDRRQIRSLAMQFTSRIKMNVLSMMPQIMRHINYRDKYYDD